MTYLPHASGESDPPTFRVLSNRTIVVASDQAELRKSLCDHLRSRFPDVLESPSLKDVLERWGQTFGPQAAVISRPDPGEARIPAADPTPESGLENDTDLVGISESIEKVRHLVQRLASQEALVYLSGEPGTGRTRVARALHRASSQAKLPFVRVECGAWTPLMLDAFLFGSPGGAAAGGPEGPQGLLGSSQIGTVYLADLPMAALSIQRKIESAIDRQEYVSLNSSRAIPVRARLLASSESEPVVGETEGTLLASLHARLALLEIALPPLRSRVEDLPALARYFVDRISAQLRRPAPELDRSAERALMGHSWPGNLRELKHVLERTLILLEAPLIRDLDLPRPVHPPSQRRENLREARLEFELLHIRRILLRYQGDMAQASLALGMDVSSIYRKLREARPRPS